MFRLWTMYWWYHGSCNWLLFIFGHYQLYFGHHRWRQSLCWLCLWSYRRYWKPFRPRLVLLISNMNCNYESTIPFRINYQICNFFSKEQDAATIFQFLRSLELFIWTVIHYLKNKVGVVDFANAQGVVMF